MNKKVVRNYLEISSLEDLKEKKIFSEKYKINLVDPVDKFFTNIRSITKIDDKIELSKIMTSLKTDKITPEFFSLAENYYLQIPKSQL